MKKADVIELIAELVDNYSNFDGSEENIERHYKYLQDFPFEAAMKNIENHIRTNQYPPTIAEIRGRLGDQLDIQRSKVETAAFETQLEKWSKDNTPPPAGYWEHGRKLLRGDSD